MGNRCCRGPKERLEAVNPALELIREAQKKYFDSHIESDQEDSELEDEDREDSTDTGLYGSVDSLDTWLDQAAMEDSATSQELGDMQVSSQGGAACRVSGEDGGTLTRDGGTLTRDGGTLTRDGGTLTRPFTGADTTETNSKPAGSKVKSKVKRRGNAKYIRLSKRGDFYSIFNTDDKKARTVDPRMYQYPFENIIFEGGGNKGLAYCGAVRLLEELNIWPQIKRLAGTSAGAMTAALLAVGYDSHDLELFFSLNLNNIFLDHRFGYCSLLPNLLTSYGWNPGRRIYKWFGQKLHQKTGDPDVTFKQVYDKFDHELCVVVTNLNQMTTLYCHPKTTPDMPVRLALRMSMCIPGLFQAVRHTLHGQTDIFVDGGVLCNYPVHCFDGWWLSMKPEDNFLEKLQPLEDIPRLLERSQRFGTYNDKTLGMQLYSDNEQDLLKYQLENLRHGVQLQDLPNTKLARDKIKRKKLQLKTDREHRRLVKAMNAFLRALNRHNIDKNETIDRGELEAALNDGTLFPANRRLILFGDVSSQVILDYLDRDHNGQVSYNELLSFMEETGISMQNRFLGYQRRVIKSFPGFLDTLQATLLTNVKRVYVEERDLRRTVGINTGHVGTSDFVLEPEDVDFVMERGRRSLEAFLKYFVATHRLKKKPEFKRGSIDLRKDSKGSLISSSSNQSLDEINPGAAASVPLLSPVAEAPKFLFRDTARAELQLPHDQTHSTTDRTTSVSSTKSVSISDAVEVIGQKLLKHSHNQSNYVKPKEYRSENKRDHSENRVADINSEISGIDVYLGENTSCDNADILKEKYRQFTDEIFSPAAETNLHQQVNGHHHDQKSAEGSTVSTTKFKPTDKHNFFKLNVLGQKSEKQTDITTPLLPSTTQGNGKEV